MEPWTKSLDTRYTAEASTLSITVDGDKCPKCGKGFSVRHLVDIVRHDYEIVKWVYQHDCQTTLVVFND